MYQVKKMFICLLGIFGGIITVYWSFICYLLINNGIYDKYSYQWEEDGEWFRLYGYIGIFIYLIFFFSIILLNRRNKKQLLIILTSMIVGIIGTMIYLFA